MPQLTYTVIIIEMADKKSQLSKRLHSLYEGADFFSFFEKYAKKPARKYRKGTTLFYEGDPTDKIYFIKSGFIKLYRVSKKGRDAVIYLYGPGSILGLRALTAKDRILRHSADTLTECEINSITRDEYIEILSENPENIIDLMHMFIQRLNNAERKLEGFILTDTLARVANFLYDCAHRFGVKQENLIVLPLPLTHQRIADFVGTFRETATIAINKLEDEKIIKSEKGKITIYDMKKLEEKAQLQDDVV